MNWCKPHWDQLRTALAEKGLDKFGAQDGTQAVKQLAAEIEGYEAPFDPLIGCWSRINSTMATSLTQSGRGSEILLLKCPLCILVEDGQPETVDNWIDGVTEDALKYAQSKGLIRNH